MAGARWLFRRDWEDCVVIGFACLFSNSILLGLPITERAFGHDALTGNYAIIAFHAPFVYMLGVTAMEIARAEGRSAGATMLSVLRTWQVTQALLADFPALRAYRDVTTARTVFPAYLYET